MGPAHLEDEYGLKIARIGAAPSSPASPAPSARWSSITRSPVHRPPGRSSTARGKDRRDYFTEDGVLRLSRWGSHTHSTTCVMSSLAPAGGLDSPMRCSNESRLLRQWACASSAISSAGRSKIARPKPTPTGGSQQHRRHSRNRVDPRAAARSEDFQDAEHILRGHLLPSQLRDVSWIVDPANPERIDGLRDVANRHLGAFGFPAPYGHAPLDYEEIRFNMDIVGGATGSLCEAWRATVQQS